MSEQNLNKLMNGLQALSAMAILIGALLKISLYSFGNHILMYGFIAQFIFSSIEISRLKKTIKKLEERTIVE
jgi:hypothetical protein